MTVGHSWPWALGASLLGHLGLLAAIGFWSSGRDADGEIGATDEGARLRVSLRAPTQTTPAHPRPAAAPAPEPSATAPESSGASGPARCLSRIDPVYPLPCLRRGHQGRCLLAIAISADGRATEIGILISTGCPDLDQAAVEAARAANYQSARDHGRAVAARLELAVRFVLE